MLKRPGYAVGLIALLFAAIRCGSPAEVVSSGNGFSGFGGGSDNEAGAGNTTAGGGSNLNTGADAGSSTGPNGDAGCSGTNCAPGSDTAVCGDGILQAGEGCDDGNHKAGDGCTADCKVQ